MEAEGRGASPAGSSRRPRSPGFVYAGISLVITLVVGLVALTQAQPPPPTIAEFAPQAIEQIEDAPDEQSSDVGSDIGGEGDGTAATPPPLDGIDTPPPIDVPRIRRCIGDPPRQIEDPQSPPCVPHWEGENGGATARGVTRDEIRVAIRTSDDELSRIQRALQAFFNRRFEFYGRRITLVPFRVQDNVTIAQMQADAQRADDLDVFAVLGYSEQVGREVHFYDELARREIISVQGAYTGISIADGDHLARFAPYQWNYLPTVDKILRNYAEFTCNILAGKPPVYAAGLQREAELRKFGVITQDFVDGSPSIDLAPLRQGAARCGVTFEEAKWPHGDPSAATRGAKQIIIQMREEGVTSLLCLCPAGGLAINFMQSSTEQGYFPEWLISNYQHQDDDFAGGLNPPEQAEQVIGLMSHNKAQPLSDMPWHWAVKETDPSYQYGQSQDRPIAILVFDYWNLLLLASGIQMAGPELTPHTFGSALETTRFPNPGAAGPPYYQATVGFGPRDHTMIQDLAMVWWNRSARSEMVPGQTGAYCYVDAGTRFGPGSWPQEDPRFRQAPCR